MTIPRSPVEPWLAEKIGTPGVFSLAALRDYQLRMLRRSVAYARQHSAWYAEQYRDIRGEDIASLADLPRLPLLDSSLLRERYTDLLCVNPKHIERIVTLPSSGSEGPPKRVFFTAEDLELTVDFFARGMLTMVAPGDKVLILMPGPLQNSIGQLLAQGLRRHGVTPLVFGPVKDMDAAGAAIRDFAPDCIVGIPAQVCKLAKSHPEFRVGKVLLSADYLPKSAADTISRAWGSEVFDHYGMTEMGLGGGVECAAHSGYHLREADMIFEIIDPQTLSPLPYGEYGEVVFTTLTRAGMPLLRYRTGDISRLLPPPCPCGAEIPRLDKIAGRISNAIRLGGDKILSIHLLDEIMFSCAPVIDYTAEYNSEAGHLQLKILAPGDADFDLLAAQIKERLALPLTIELGRGEGFMTNGPQKRSIMLK